MSEGQDLINDLNIGRSGMNEEEGFSVLLNNPATRTESILNVGGGYVDQSKTNQIPGKPPYLGSVTPNQSSPPRFENNEEPLTHHQQAVKDFMVAIIISGNKEGLNEEGVSNEASRLADAFINQIKK